MGISGLLPLLKSIQRPTDLKKYAGETIAVDAYGWLHRGAISCAVELALDRPTRRYIDSVMNRVRMVQHCGVTPYLVFDGDFLPSKAGTEASRAKRREESRKAGQELLNAGKAKQAYLEFQKAIDVTPEMARCLIEELKKLGLPYIVAPYEADPQMVYLERQGLVCGILSEDSDLLVFGAKRLLTKLDMQGNCIEINRREFCAVREISLTDWTDAEFRHMAILSGCDYLEGVGNIGLKTAYRMIRKHKTIEKVVRRLQFDGKYKVSENYLAAFYQAELTFLHQRIFCPIKNQLILLSEPTNGVDVEQMKFIGNPMDNETARGVALGDLNPMTKEPIILALSPGKKRRASSIASSNGSNRANGSPFGPTFPRTPNQQTPRKPIGEYFSSRNSSASRIPLGAMDPNVFSIDRQQVAVLTQNGLTPRVFPLPRPYVDGGRTSLPSQPASASRTMSTISNPRLRRRLSEPVSNLVQSGTGALLNTPSTSSLYRRQASAMLPPSTRPVSLSQTTPRSTPTTGSRPQKKARLTTDDLDLPDNTKHLEKSKYFSPAATTSAASSKMHESLLMSDDSVEEAMLSLPDMDEWDISMSSKSATSSMRVFEDRASAKTTDRIPDSDGIEIPESPVAKPKRHSTVNDTSDSTPASQLSLGRFSYKGAASMANGLPTPESSFVGSQEYAANKVNAHDTCTPPASSGQAVKRPKKVRQSLGELVEATSALRSESDRPRNKKASKIRRSMEASAPAAVNPSFVPLPPADLEEVAALSRVQGSEDQIVPDSDAEDDDFDAPVHGMQSSARFNLARFLCP